MLPPHLNHHPSLIGRVKDLAVQAFIAELPIERFAVAVLPGASRLDIQRPGADRLKPLPHPLGCHLSTVVGTHVLGHAVLQHALAQSLDQRDSY